MATSTRPLLLTVLALVVAIEALGVSVYAAWYGAQFFVTQTGSLGGALFLVGLRMRTFTRAGTLVWQTIQVVVGVSMISAEGDWLFVGLGMIIFGVLAGAITFAPSVVAVIARKPE
jgi:hypothetical protein